MIKNINKITLNENNIQAPFQYLIGEDNFELLEYTDEFILTEDNPRLKYREDQKYFIVDLGASIDGDINNTNILIDNVKIYPVRVGAIEELKDAVINENNFGFIANDNNFKSVIILPKSNINKRLKYTIYTYATSLSNYMFDEVARKLNTLDIDYPVKNFYQNESYKINDIIKYNGYLYRVLKDFNNTENDDKLLMSNAMAITPFKRLENKSYKLYDILEIDNKYFIVQKPFTYSDNKSLENNLSPLVNIIDWYSDIEKIYKNTILIKDGRKYLAVNEVRMPIWEEVYKNSVIDFIKADEIPADNNENIQEAINRIDKNIEKEIKDRTEADNNLQQNIDNEINNRIEADNEIKEIKQDKIQNGIDNIIHNKSYNVIDTDLSIDKTNPIMMDGDSIDIAINTNGNIKINLEANNLGYELNKNILTIKKINIAEGADYSGVLTITANKNTDLENIYKEKSITIYINSNTLYTDLSVDNDVLNIEPNTNIDLAVNTNADTIEYYIDNTNYEITKTNKTLNIKNISTAEKTGAVLTITALALSTENTTYVAKTIRVYINRTKAEAKELLTLDVVSSIEASNNSILKRDGEGASNINMPANIKNTTVINNEYLEEQLQSGLSTKQDKLTAGTNVEITKDNIINVKGDVATDAKSVSYDNSNTNLEYISGYSFPNFNVEIPTYNLVLTDGTTDFNVSISRQEDGSYLLNGILENFNITNTNEINIKIKSINNITNSYSIYALSSILSQFFNIENISSESLSLFEALENEINIQNKNNNFEFGFYADSIDNSNFYLKIKSTETLETTPSTITLNIKNRVLRNTDVNIFYINNNNYTIGQIQLNQINSSVAYQGTYNGYTNPQNILNFYSDLDMRNYFNLSSNDTTFTNTTGITSSNGKTVKFLIKLIENNIYNLVITYQDGSQIQEGDIFTFNLIPDNNCILDPIYKNVTNVQELGESLALRYMINPYYVQYADLSGNFNSNEEPSVWFKKMYNVNTTWQIIFNSESVYFRTEGDLANVERSNGIQNDAGRNATASFFIRGSIAMQSSGVLVGAFNSKSWASSYTNTDSPSSITLDLSRAYSIANEFRVRNRLMRIYKLLTINDKSVNEIMEEF